MNEILNLLSNPKIKSGAISIISISLTMLFKLLCRKDVNFRYTQNDLSIGIALITSAIAAQVNGLFGILEANKSKKTVEINIFNEFLEKFIVIAICSIAIVMLIIVIRRHGWQPTNEKEPTLWIGVIVPICLGLLLLIYSLSNL